MPQNNFTQVYFIQSEKGGPVKIGKADHAKSRLASHQTSHPEKLRIVILVSECPAELEKLLHKHYANFRLNGEWFKGEILYNIQEVVDIIKSKCKKPARLKEKDWIRINAPDKKPTPTFIFKEVNGSIKMLSRLTLK